MIKRSTVNQMLFLIGILMFLSIFPNSGQAQPVPDEELGTNRQVIDCTNFDLSVQGRNMQPIEDGTGPWPDGYALVLTKSDTQTRTVVDAHFVTSSDFQDDIFTVNKTYRFAVQRGSNSCGEGQIWVPEGNYKLQLYRTFNFVTGVYDVDFNEPVGNAIDMQFLYIPDAELGCQVSTTPPNTVRVIGTRDYFYTVKVNGTDQNSLNFIMDGTTPQNPLWGERTFTVPSNMLIQGQNHIRVTGTNRTDTSKYFACDPQGILNTTTPSITVNPGEATCGQMVSFKAEHLIRDRSYRIRLQCTGGGGPGTPGNTNCVTGEQVEIRNIPKPHEDVVFTDKNFNIGNGCGSGLYAKPGTYKVQLIDETGVIATPEPSLKLTVGLGCNITNTINVLSVNGVLQSEGKFTLAGSSGVAWGIFINNTFFKSQIIPASGEAADITIPKNLINTIPAGASQDAVNNTITATFVQPGGQVQRCEGSFQTYTLAWDCGYIEGNRDYNCDVCGEGRRCGNTNRCIVDTTNYCTSEEDPPTCNLEDACGSCPHTEICFLNPATNGLECKYDGENVCGELETYNRLEGLVGNFGTFEEFLESLRTILIPLGIVLGVVFFLICGYKFMTSQGHPDKMRDAKECLTSAIIGILVVTMSVSIINTLINLAFKVM